MKYIPRPVGWILLVAGVALLVTEVLVISFQGPSVAAIIAVVAAVAFAVIGAVGIRRDVR